MSRLAQDGTSKPVSRDQILRHEQGQGNINFPCSADHEQDWQPYPVDSYWCYMCDHTSVQYNGGFLPDIVLLTQCYYHRGTCLTAMERFFFAAYVPT